MVMKIPNPKDIISEALKRMCSEYSEKISKVGLDPCLPEIMSQKLTMRCHLSLVTYLSQISRKLSTVDNIRPSCCEI
jgi:hypothetical protein